MNYFDNCCPCFRTRRLSAEHDIELVEFPCLTHSSPPSHHILHSPNNVAIVNEISTIAPPNIPILTIPPLNFINEKELGSGSFGTVYKSSWKNFDVAVKSFSENSSNNTLFHREVNIMKNLLHPNIIAIYHAETIPKCIIVMELAATSLSTVVHSETSPYNLAEALNWSIQCASGLEYIHSKRILHRDLKPANLLLMNNPSVLKICDFGLSRMWEAKMSKGVGTDLYMAPEVFNVHDYEVSCDVYSFGITLWEVLHRAVPYEGLSSGLNIPHAVGACNLHPIAISESLPTQMNNLVERCWSIVPTKRPSMTVVITLLNYLMRNFPGFVPTPLTHPRNRDSVLNEYDSNLPLPFSAEMADTVLTIPTRSGELTSSSSNFISN